MSRWNQRFFARYMAANADESEARYVERKQALFGDLDGRVLELGPGTGANLDYLPEAVSWSAIEPNPEMHPFLRERATAAGREVTLLEGFPDADASVDHVISSLVLCSVGDLAATLADIRRVLRPGGTFRFVEHVADRPGARRVLQELAVYSPWTYLSDGCDPRRDIASAIEAAGFASLTLERYMQEGSGLAQSLTRPHISGVAVR